MANVYWFGNGGNWSDQANHWSNNSGNVPASLHGAAPGTDDNAIFDLLSFTLAAQTVTVDAAASCLNMDWTGATNTPTLAVGTQSLIYNGNAVFIAAMVITGTTGEIRSAGTGKTLTTNTLSIGCRVGVSAGSLTLGDAFIGTNRFYVSGGTFSSANFGITCTNFWDGTSATAKTFTLGSSTVNCTAFDMTGSNNTFTANTATINVSGANVALGNADYGDADFNLNGTAHTVSGSPTGIGVFTRNGTATNANSITLTSGTTLTCTTFAMIGNSRANQLHVLTTTLGSPATITATNWTGTNNADLMDITVTNAVDFSAAGLNILTIGNGGGNTGITFPAAAAQTYTNTGDAKASTAANWTSRVPLVGIDDVTIGATITDDMPRMGKSVTTTGTITVTGSTTTSFYGNLTVPSTVTWTGFTGNYFRGRGNYVITLGGQTLAGFMIRCPTGTYTLGSNLIISGVPTFNHEAGSFNSSIYNVTGTQWVDNLSPLLTRSLNMGSGTWTLSAITAIAKWNVSSTGLTFDAGTSTIILTNSSANAQTFAGGGLTYNNVTQTGAGNYALTITGDNTMKLKIDASAAAKTLTLGATAQNFLDLRRDGSTNVITITGGTLSGQIGRCNMDYLSLTGVVATPTLTYYAGTHSTDGGGNTNWIFNNMNNLIKSSAYYVSNLIVQGLISNGGKSG
jgi:hypothetical protein